MEVPAAGEEPWGVINRVLSKGFGELQASVVVMLLPSPVGEKSQERQTLLAGKNTARGI